MLYPFTQSDAEIAARTWGCNCGPSALAFALQTSLDVARDAIPKFDDRRYTSPTMMRDALLSRGIKWTSPQEIDRASMFDDRVALIRIQWTGPWTAPGSNPKWAYGYTHWITTWRDHGRSLVFDINGGVMEFLGWEREIVPLLIKEIKRADGDWRPTHIWRIAQMEASA